MTVLDRLNGLPRAAAIEELLQVCHSARWAAAVADARPYAEVSSVQLVADDVWQRLDAADWLEALAGHPRIGERGGSSPELSRREQAGMIDADAEIVAAIAAGNREYEHRFGHVFLICAAGRSPQEILTNLRSRLGNDPETELRIAADQHRRITRLRLETALSSQSMT